MSRHRALAAQLAGLLDARVLDPLDILLGATGPDGTGPDSTGADSTGPGRTRPDDAVAALRELVRRRADGWAAVLLGPDETAAARFAMRVVAALYPGDTAFEPPPQWWATPFGQVVARRVGHPTTEGLSYAAAGAMLGITRQGVHDLVRRGKLARHTDGGVLATSVRDRLRDREESE